jgi:hypothetical protein
MRQPLDNLSDILAEVIETRPTILRSIVAVRREESKADRARHYSSIGEIVGRLNKRINQPNNRRQPELSARGLLASPVRRAGVGGE